MDKIYYVLYSDRDYYFNQQGNIVIYNFKCDDEVCAQLLLGDRRRTLKSSDSLIARGLRLVDYEFIDATTLNITLFNSNPYHTSISKDDPLLVIKDYKSSEADVCAKLCNSLSK